RGPTSSCAPLRLACSECEDADNRRGPGSLAIRCYVERSRRPLSRHGSRKVPVGYAPGVARSARLVRSSSSPLALRRPNPRHTRACTFSRLPGSPARGSVEGASCSTNRTSLPRVFHGYPAVAPLKVPFAEVPLLGREQSSTVTQPWLR